MEISWKFFYYFVKIHALAHFTYDDETKKVYYSPKWALYGCTWISGYLIELILLSYSILLTTSRYNESEVLHFVHVTELSTILLKTLFMYVLQTVRSKDVVVLINEAISLNQMINDKYRLKRNVYGRRFCKLYNSKKWYLLVQFVLIFTSFFIYVHLKDPEMGDIIFGSFLVYTHFFTVVVSGVSFYGSLLYGYNFYYNLNRKLKSTLKKVRFNAKDKTQIESCCQACDDLDKLSIVYTRISLYLSKVNRLSVIQITGELLAAFIMTTCGLFYLFYALLQSKDSLIWMDHVKWEQTSYEIFNSMIYCLVYVTEIHLIITISNTVSNEADNLSKYIHQSLYVNADKRFTECVQQLSLKAFLEKSKISPLGLFTIDRSLMVGIGSTIVTYLVILVQFQLDRVSETGLTNHT